ncbi:MAG: hypothetical protein PVJ76_09030 [Gemmatimonadota bacterium]|jgi:hypothetical protein
MDRRRRIIIATVWGFVAGILCYLGGRYWFGLDISPPNILLILSHRTLLGFVIGISALRWPWALHGIVLGLIVGIPDIHFRSMIQGNLIGGAYFLMGPVYGLMIEFFTTVVFKARQVQV